MVAGRDDLPPPLLPAAGLYPQEIDQVFDLIMQLTSDQIMRDLDAAVAQLPRSAHREEAAPLAEELARVQKQRGAGPQPLGEILPAVLAKLGVDLVQSTRVRGG